MNAQSSKSSLSRREFLHRVTALSGAAALAAALEGCSISGIDQETLIPPTGAADKATAVTENATPVPSATDDAASEEPAATSVVESDDGKSRVAFVKTSDRAEGVSQALALVGFNSVARKSVFLKPNYNSADPTPGSTHPDVLATLVNELKRMGAQKITVGDRSGMGNTRQVMERLDVFKLAQEMGFETVVFDELTADDWVKIQLNDGHWSKGFYIARPCLDADVLVQTCCLKTHRYGGHFTLSLKNSVGMVAKHYPGESYNYMTELHSSAHQRRMIAEINTAYTPSLVVLDGVDAFISGGPDSGKKVDSQVILAGTDRVAIDAVGVAILRYFGCKTEAARGRIFEQEQIARAVELGLGVDKPEKIEFLTADSDSEDYSGKIKEVLLAD